jgi:two-component system response regulator
MEKRPPPLRIVVADDDPDDRMLLEDAFAESGLTAAAADIVFVRNGEELLDCLLARGEFSGRSLAGSPPLVLLDLNMPRMDGREALREIKSHKGLRCVPVVVLTTSDRDDDVVGSYEQGANSYITKPTRYDDILVMAREMKAYWIDLVKRPSQFTLS